MTQETQTRTDQAGAPVSRRVLRAEVLLVLGVSLGIAAIRAAVYLVGALTGPKALADSRALLNTSSAPGRPWLDLSLQMVGMLAGLVPALLAVHLLTRDGDVRSGSARLGLDRGRVGGDAVRGGLLALVIGVPGLALYLVSHALGLSAQVVPESLPAVWWRIPVLVLSAAQNGVLEEVVVTGYLVTRLGQLGWRPWSAVVGSSVLRGGYHLYQGFSGFAGNLVMGLIFARFFQRTGRVLPLILAHTLLDTAAFVGYAALHGHVSWLP
ncbi:MAG TPA: CPBP family intramembrane glutamic endopeptidase [Mycobacteriales bacterium]